MRFGERIEAGEPLNREALEFHDARFQRARSAARETVPNA
jgi:hypothetical protein